MKYCIIYPVFVWVLNVGEVDGVLINTLFSLFVYLLSIGFLLLLLFLVTDEAFVTLATNDSYALGALVLGNSLKVVGTTRCLAVMVTHDVQESLR